MGDFFFAFGKLRRPLDVAAAAVRPREFCLRHGVGDGGGEFAPFVQIRRKIPDDVVLLEDALQIGLVAQGEAIEAGLVMAPNVLGEGGVGRVVSARGVRFQQAQGINNLLYTGGPGEFKQAVDILFAGNGRGGRRLDRRCRPRAYAAGRCSGTG